MKNEDDYLDVGRTRSLVRSAGHQAVTHLNIRTCREWAW